MSFIKRKTEKAEKVFDSLDTITEEAFIERFKEMYPNDWVLIIEKWEAEERNTPHGKKHPMPRPDIYMKNMFRNAMSRRNKTNEQMKNLQEEQK